jgi:hypothetical protein
MRIWTSSFAASLLAFSWTCTLFCPTAVRAATVTIGASKDNTLYEEGELSNGAGNCHFAGKTGVTGDLSRRRTVIAFDIAGALPDDAVISAVTLTLYLSKTRFGAPVTATSLFPLLADWGEGTSKAFDPEGQGAPATPGDATWTQRFFGGGATNWTTPGGDFNSQASATTQVGSLTNDIPVPFSWSGPRMVADAQSWLTSPSTNFGWLIISNEVADQAAKRFNSRTNPVLSTRPALAITYEIIPEPGTAGMLSLGLLLLPRRRAHAR